MFCFTMFIGENHFDVIAAKWSGIIMSQTVDTFANDVLAAARIMLRIQPIAPSLKSHLHVYFLPSPPSELSYAAETQRWNRMICAENR